MEFDDLKILGDALIDGETDEGPHDLCPISACRTGIDIKGIESGIVLDHEDVRVTGDKDLGSLCLRRVEMPNEYLPGRPTM